MEVHGRTDGGQDLTGRYEYGCRLYFLNDEVVAIGHGNLEEASLTQYACLEGIWAADQQTTITDRAGLAEIRRSHRMDLILHQVAIAIKPMGYRLEGTRILNSTGGLVYWFECSTVTNFFYLYDACQNFCTAFRWASELEKWL